VQVTTDVVPPRQVVCSWFESLTLITSARGRLSFFLTVWL